MSLAQGHDLRRQNDELRAEIQRLTRTIEKLTHSRSPAIRFTARWARVWWDPYLGEGPELQESMLELGLIERVTMNEPCDDECSCEEAGCDFPTSCYQPTEMLRTIRRVAEVLENESA